MKTLLTPDPPDEPADVDPFDCGGCLALGDLCRFHAGMAAGWDLLVAYVAERKAEP